MSDLPPRPASRAAFAFVFVTVVLDMLGAAFGLGFIVGPAVGGLLGAIDLRLPFWAAAGLSLLNAADGFFVLPESLPRERRAGLQWRVANPLGAVRLLRTNRVMLGLTSAMVLFFLATRQGQLQGALSSLRGLTGMAGPLLFTQLFAFGIRGDHHLPGAAYLLGALLLLGSSWVAALALRGSSREPGPASPALSPHA